MKILPLHTDLRVYLKQRNLDGKLEKQQRLFEQNPFHPSLATELLEPKRMRIWSFRVDRRYRAIFMFRDRETVEIVDVNNHYQ